MPGIEYAELHCHSAFSLLDGASNPEELVARAKRVGLRALALTDRDDMGGIVRFAHAAREVEARPSCPFQNRADGSSGWPGLRARLRRS